MAVRRRDDSCPRPTGDNEPGLCACGRVLPGMGRNRRTALSYDVLNILDVYHQALKRATPTTDPSTTDPTTPSHNRPTTDPSTTLPPSPHEQPAQDLGLSHHMSTLPIRQQRVALGVPGAVGFGLGRGCLGLFVRLCKALGSADAFSFVGGQTHVAGVWRHASPPPLPLPAISLSITHPQMLSPPTKMREQWLRKSLGSGTYQALYKCGTTLCFERPPECEH